MLLTGSLIRLRSAEGVCGYDFESRRMQRSYLQPKQAARAAAIGAVGIGGIFVALALMRKIVWLLTEFTK